MLFSLSQMQARTLMKSIKNPIIPPGFSWPSTLFTVVAEVNKVPHATMFNAVATAFSDMWAAQFTFPRLIFF